MQCTGATRCQIEKREQCNQMVKVEGIIYQSRKADFPFNETHTRLLNCNVLNPSPIINPLLFFLTQWAENISEILELFFVPNMGASGNQFACPLGIGGRVSWRYSELQFPFNETHTRLLNCNVLNPSPIINPLFF